MNSAWRALQGQLGRRPAEIALVTFVLVMVGSLIVPLPTWGLDLLLSLNLAVAIVLLLVGLASQGVRSVVALPSILLLSTLARLCLNIASTRLILLDADAGRLIEAFGDFVVQGNTLVGVVVFLILTLVNFMVISRGSERIAEVAARFSLDAMPGRQMAIDADLRAQAITLEEAQRQRQSLQEEARQFGAMDGAMKFVKGDAVAGMVITGVNLVGGLVVGVLQRDMSLPEAARVYSLLTIGDGLVSQIPALLVATAAGLMITRVQDTRDHLGADIARGLMAYPRALTAAALILALLALVPGLPLLPLLVLASVVAWVAWRAHKIPLEGEATDEPTGPRWMQLSIPAQALHQHRDALQEIWASEAAQTEEVMGFAPPALRLEVGEPGRWLLRLRRVPEAQGPWTEAMDGGSLGMLRTALHQALRRHLATALGPQEVKLLLDEVRQEAPEDVEALVPRLLDLSQCTEVLQRLVSEGVPLHDRRALLGALVSASRTHKDPALLAESVRPALQRAMSWRFAGAARHLRAWQLHPEVEDMLQSSLQPQAETLPLLALSRELRREILQAARKAWAAEPAPVLLTSPALRPHAHAFLRAANPDLVVLSYQELLDDVQIQSAGTVSVRQV